MTNFLDLPVNIQATILLFLADDYYKLITISPRWKNAINYIFKRVLMKQTFESFMSKYIDILSI